MPDPHDEHAESEQIEVTEAMVLAGAYALRDGFMLTAEEMVTAIYRTMEIQKRFGEE